MNMKLKNQFNLIEEKMYCCYQQIEHKKNTKMGQDLKFN